MTKYNYEMKQPNEIVVPKVPRPQTISFSVWEKMSPLQQYNLSYGLLVYDKKTKRCKRSKLGGSTNTEIPRDLEFVSEFRDVVKRVQKKTKKKIAKKKARTHHRSINPLVIVSGNGSFEFSDESKYVGEIKSGVPNGSGIRSWKDGSTYTGGWKNGERVGQGSMVYPTGEEYVGQWKNDTKTGRGTMFRKNGSMFTGDWKNNLVVIPFTKKSQNQQAFTAYKLYLKQGGTYEKVGNKLGITTKQAKALVRRHCYINDIVQRPSLDPIRFTLTSKRKAFIVATEKLYGRVFIINRKILNTVWEKNKHLPWAQWAIEANLRTDEPGWYYFPDNKGELSSKGAEDALHNVRKLKFRKKVSKRSQNLSHNQFIPPKPKTSISSSSIEVLELTPQTLRTLKTNHIDTIRDLTGRTESDLLKIPTLRKSVVNDLKEALEELGLSLSYIQEYPGIRPGITG